MDRTQVPIRTPCGADWNAMDPRGSARLCRTCDKLVHDLSGSTEQAAHRVLASTPESLCVRYLYDATGRIWFADDLERLTAPSQLNRAKRGTLAAALIMTPLLAAPALMQACGGAAPFDPYDAQSNTEPNADAGADAHPATAGDGDAGSEAATNGDR